MNSRMDSSDTAVNKHTQLIDEIVQSNNQAQKKLKDLLENFEQFKTSVDIRVATMNAKHNA